MNSEASNKPPFRLAYTRRLPPKGGEGIADTSTESPFSALYGEECPVRDRNGVDTMQVILDKGLTPDLRLRNSFDKNPGAYEQPRDCGK